MPSTITLPVDLGWSKDDVSAFRADVGRFAMANQPLDAATRDRARVLFREVFRDGVRDEAHHRLQSDPTHTLLVRLAARGETAGLSLEAMDPSPNRVLETTGPIGTSAALHVVRQVDGDAPAKPEMIVGRVRVLVLAVTHTGVENGVKQALAEAVENRAVEPLDVIPSEQVATLAHLHRALQERGAPSRRPHILHIIGHGGISDGPEPEPILVLPSDDDQPVRIPVRVLADELTACFGNHLRLIVLDSCDGAAPSPSGSAAERLAERAAVAVLAHLWPLSTAIAREVARSFYTSLTLSRTANGDVAEALQNARRDLLVTGAAAFSPVLYLRGESPVLFDFRTRLKPVSPGSRAAAAPRAASDGQLRRILGDSFSLLLGDPGEDLADWYAALETSIAKELDSGNAARTLSDAVQRYALARGREQLRLLFQEVFGKLLNDNDRPVPPLTVCLAEALRPGVHVTLLWTPILEQALAERHPDRDVYVVQPPLTHDHTAPLWVLRRRAGEVGWSTPPNWRKEMRPDNDYVVIRANGGYLPGKEVRDTLFTDEDFADLDWSADMPPGWARLIGVLKDAPALLVGISILNWRHRTAVRQLFDQMLPQGSVTVLPPDAEDFEENLWSERGGGLGERKGTTVAVVRLGSDDLAEIVLKAAP